MDLNRATIIGNVVRDPEVSTTPSGQNVVSFSVATNFIWNDKNGQRQKKAEFHNIVAWRKLADVVGQYVRKGSRIFLEGRIETRSWDDQNGVKRYRTEIIADNMIMLDRPGQRTASNNGSQPIRTSEPAAQNFQRGEPTISADVPTTAGAGAKEQEIDVEDIPF